MLLNFHRNLWIAANHAVGLWSHLITCSDIIFNNELLPILFWFCYPFPPFLFLIFSTLQYTITHQRQYSKESSCQGRERGKEGRQTGHTRPCRREEERQWRCFRLLSGFEEECFRVREEEAPCRVPGGDWRTQIEACWSRNEVVNNTEWPPTDPFSTPTIRVLGPVVPCPLIDSWRQLSLGILIEHTQGASSDAFWGERKMVWQEIERHCRVLFGMWMIRLKVFVQRYHRDQ